MHTHTHVHTHMDTFNNSPRANALGNNSKSMTELVVHHIWKGHFIVHTIICELLCLKKLKLKAEITNVLKVKIKAINFNVYCSYLQWDWKQ